MPKAKIIIIGAGTAGLSAFHEAKKYQQNVLIVDQTPLGSTCARTGCMPSKALIEIANQFQATKNFAKLGIRGGHHLSVRSDTALQHVRQLRDHFTAGVVRSTESIGKQLVLGEAVFQDPQTISIENKRFYCDKMIIATGSRPLIPAEWQDLHSDLLTSDNFFEQRRLPESVAVIGAGIIGLELGQAMARLGVTVTLLHKSHLIGGLTDPRVNAEALRLMRQEVTLLTGHEAQPDKNKTLRVLFHNHHVDCEKILIAVGRVPNALLPMDNLPTINPNTMRIGKLPLYMAGDVSNERPLLHEVADEGRIAGYNAAHSRNRCFQRRTPLRITFTSPNIGVVGQAFADLETDTTIVGEINFSDQGRAKLMQQNHGLLRVYANKKSGMLLGAEFVMPQGEHIAHLLALAIHHKMTAATLLQMPFYHPVIEEGLRTALRKLNRKTTRKSMPTELALCESHALME